MIDNQVVLFFNFYICAGLESCGLKPWITLMGDEIEAVCVPLILLLINICLEKHEAKRKFQEDNVLVR